MRPEGSVATMSVGDQEAMVSGCPPSVTLPALAPKLDPWTKRFALSASARRMRGPSPLSLSCRSSSRHSFLSLSCPSSPPPPPEPCPPSLPARTPVGKDRPRATIIATTGQRDGIARPLVDLPGPLASEGASPGTAVDHCTTRRAWPPKTRGAHAKPLGSHRPGTPMSPGVCHLAAAATQPMKVSITMISSRSTSSLRACCSSPAMSARILPTKSSTCWTVPSTSSSSASRVSCASAARCA